MSLKNSPYHSIEFKPCNDGEKYVKDQAIKSKRQLRLVKVCLTSVLILAIFFIWTSLLSPLAIAYFARPSLDNVSRPHFDLLNPTSIVCNASDRNMSYNQSNVSCPDNYVFRCPMCLPICGLWHPFGDSYFVSYRVIAIIIGITNLLLSTTITIIFVRVPGSLSFPKVIYFFMFLSLIILSIPLALIAIMGPHQFFCALRNEDFETVAASPSILVSVFGAVSHYTYISFDLCFFVAAFNIFILIFFPHWQIMNSVKKKRAFFLGEFIVCICIPFLFPIVYLAIYHQYSFTRVAILPFPLGDPITPFVMAICPLLLTTGGALTLVTLAIYRVQIMKYLIHKSLRKFKSYEIRHIIFAIIYGFTVSFILIELSVQFTNEAITNYLLDEFWACTTLQYNPQFLANQSLAPVNCVASYRKHIHPILMMLRYVTTGISSVEIIIFLTTKETYDAWRRSFRSVFKTISVKTSSIGLTSSKN